MGSLSEHLVSAREAEAFLVLEGNVSYRAGDETYELDDGCFIHLPQSASRRGSAA